jgi:hypothetical protein
MPARVFRFLLKNDVPGHTLRRVAVRCCFGEFTSGDWYPDETIEFGVNGGLQAESAGVLQGTEGWAKYRIVRDSDGAARGLVYLYWDNPYFGVTHGRAELFGVDVKADCDDDASGGGSSFTDATGENEPPADLKLSLVVARRDGSPTVIDEPGDAYRVPLAPVFIFGTAGIWERMEVELRLTSSAESTVIPPLLPQPGQRTRRLDVSPSPREFAGTWSNGTVAVTIEPLGRSQYHVTVKDQTAGAPLSLDATTILGSEGLGGLLQRDASVRMPTGGGADTDASRLTDPVRAGGLGGALPGGIGDISRGGLASRVAEAAPLGAIGVDEVSRPADAVRTRTDYALYLGDAISVELYDEFEDGQRRGHTLHYQRMADDGAVIADAYLGFLPAIR